MIKNNEFAVYDALRERRVRVRYDPNMRVEDLKTQLRDYFDRTYDFALSTVVTRVTRENTEFPDIRRLPTWETLGDTPVKIGDVVFMGHQS